MDLNGAIGKIKVGSCEVVEMPPVVRSLPTNEVQASINSVCYPGMHYNDLFGAVAKLASSGIPPAELYAESKTFEPYVSPESNSISAKGVDGVIRDYEKGYSHQVGTRPTKSLPADCFPEEMYNQLHPSLRAILLLLDEPRKRDVCFIGMVAALSAAYARYRFYHGSGSDVKEYSPHLLALVIGAAGSGKGLTRYGNVLVEQITRAAIEMRKKAMENYRIEKHEYDRVRKKREKEGLPLSDLIEPVKPKKYGFGISASDTTQAALVEILYENGIGCFGYDSEVDTMVQGNAKKEYGGYGDVIRKVFHHEPLARQRKGEGESYIVNEPRLAVMLSGTHDQLKKLIPSEYNGLFSRLWYYVIPPVFQPYKMATQQNDIVGEACRNLQNHVSQSADLWSDELVYLEFSHKQELELFNAMQDKEAIETKYGGDIGASWLRMGIIIKRIAATLAGFQGAGSGEVQENCWRSAISLLPAMKSHCINALNSIRENQGKKNVSKEEYDALKATGKSDEEIAELLGVARSTIARQKKEW